MLSLAILIPAVCHGQTKCPWINEATARGILGGAANVSVTTNVTHQGDGVCKFSRQQGNAVYELRISVDIMTDTVIEMAVAVQQGMTGMAPAGDRRRRPC